MECVVVTLQSFNESFEVLDPPAQPESLVCEAFVVGDAMTQQGLGHGDSLG
jgi:hypothetical protein